MTSHNPFIDRIDQYCDYWCERCALSQHCRRLAERAGRSRVHDVRVEQLGGELRAEMYVEMLRAAFEGMDDITRLGPRALERLPKGMVATLGPDPKVVANSAELKQKLERARRASDPAVRLAVETIEHFTFFVPMKMVRVVSAVVRGETSGAQSDANGSGKAALLGVDRMRAAWRFLVNTCHISEQDAAPFLAELSTFTANIELCVPAARSFVRPGFDEQHHVASVGTTGRRH